MCGRTACTLAPADICKACTHTNRHGKQAEPRWRNPPGDKHQYYQSYNIAPGSHTPILVSKNHMVDSKASEEELKTESTEYESEWVIQPMHWGLIPQWHQGDPKSVAYNMSNARSDGMLTKRTFKGPLEKGRRCVILVDGYFEWQTKDGKKQPYYIYFPPGSSDDNHADEKAPRRLLTMAGIFDVWRPKEGDAVYSYSIITVDAHQKLNFVHHRMPAILNGEDEVRQWLDYGNVPLMKAVELIRPTEDVTLHPVTPDVGNVRNKSENNVKPYDPKNPPKTKSSQMMMSWLNKGQKTEGKEAEKRPHAEDTTAGDASVSTEEPEVKKPKAE